MSNIIGFQSDVDAWYKNANSDNSWSKVINALTKSYAQANSEIAGAAASNATTARQSAQMALTGIYSSYKANKATLAGNGFSEAFKSGAAGALSKNLAVAGQSAYSSALANSSSSSSADISSDPTYAAYQKQVSDVSSAWSSIFSYFNSDDSGLNDTDNAKSLGIIDANGNITATGKVYLKTYLNMDSATASANSDAYYSGKKSTLSDYLKSKVPGITAGEIEDIGKMAGVDVESTSYSDADKKSVLGTSATSYSSSFKTGDNAKINDISVKPTFASGTDSDMRSDYSKMAEGWIGSDFKRSDNGQTVTKFDSYILNEAYSNEYVYSITKGKYSNIGLMQTASGMTVDDAIARGVLSEGDTITLNGIKVIVHGGKARINATAADIDKWGNVSPTSNIKGPQQPGSIVMH